MELLSIYAITPQLIVASGIVLAMLLIAWRRSQQLIANFTGLVIFIAIVACINGVGLESTQVTQLLAVNDYSRMGFILILAASLACLYLSKIALKQTVEVHDEYYILLLLVVLGAGVLVASDHFASLFLGFELISIALVGLVGYSRQSAFSVETGFKYLILSASASSFMLLGIAFIYAQTGDLSFGLIYEPSVSSSSHLWLYQLGFVLFLSGIAFKLSLVPFHYWTPDVYQGASSPITFLLATVSKCAMFIVLLKSCFTVNQMVIHENQHLFSFVSWIAMLSMIVGNSLALKQQSIKRLLAYSSIAHMGYLLIVLLISSHNSLAFAWQSVLFYLTAYVLASISIFLVLTLLEREQNNNEDITLSDCSGLFWRQPLLASLLILSILSFAGIPLTAGFIGKFYLVSLAANEALWSLLATLIIGSGIALAYYLPFIFALFSQEDKAVNAKNCRLTIIDALLIVSLILISLAVGIFPDVIGQVLQKL